MSQIEITVLKQGRVSDKVLSCAFFRMVSGGYREFGKYETNLKKFLEASRVLTGFEVRIYTDDTAKDFCVSLAEKYMHVSVYHYNCELFKEDDGHTGTFGTIVRFMPLFEKDLKVVWISDIDVKSTFFDLKIISAMKQNKCDVFIDSLVCYNNKPWAAVNYPIVAHRFVSFLTFQKQLLTRFLNKLHDGDYADLIKLTNEFNLAKKKVTIPNDRFPYGMDEAFINGPIYNSIKRRNANAMIYINYFFIQNYIVYTLKDQIPQSVIDDMARYYKYPDPNLFPKMKRIYLKYVPMILDAYPCMQEFLDILPAMKNTFIKVSVIPTSEL